MNNDNSNNIIHEFEFNLIGDFFKELPRQGPGNDSLTAQALGLIPALPTGAQIADLGCGTCGQTIALARNTQGHITAIDLMSSFVETGRRRVAEAGLSDRITVREGSMDELPFERGSLDLIWAEGSIYNIGFERGLRLWLDFLKPGGYVAVTEAAWFTPNPHPEIWEFWNVNYPEIDTIPAQIGRMADAGYTLHAHFILPDQAWWDFFGPMPVNTRNFLMRNAGNPAAERFARYSQQEIDLYARHHAQYGYVFYIGRKPL